jgi:hypothetical protein
MVREPRLPILFALACALFLRALVPAGWMPTPSGGAFAIEPCPAAEPLVTVDASAHRHGQTRHDPSHKGNHGSDCAFAPLLTAFAAIDVPALLPAPFASTATPIGLINAPVFTTGPPALLPPATGPPALA